MTHRFKRLVAIRVPTREQLLSSRFISPFAHRLSHGALWRFTRESVARGVALGLFAGFILPVGQVLLAAVLAPATRANLIVAAVSTLVTNPLTFPLVYWAAYRTGELILPEAAQGQATDFLTSMLGASKPTVVGLVLFAFAGAALGYLTVRLSWRLLVARRWRTRRGRT
jgi:uncharacterized protein (DUF2062 family)